MGLVFLPTSFFPSVKEIKYKQIDSMFDYFDEIQGLAIDKKNIGLAELCLKMKDTYSLYPSQIGFSENEIMN